MSKITAHEPEELLLADPEEAFQDAGLSEARWQAWELERERWYAISVELPATEYHLLERLAQRQGKTVSQLTQTLLQGVLSALLPSSMPTSG